jgi:hypothetical protein
MSRAVFQSTLGGSTTLDAEQTADTKTLVIPAADGTLVYTDDAGVATFDDISLTGAVIAGTWDGDTIDVAHGGTGAVTLTGYVKGAGTTAMTASATIPNSDITGLGTMSTQNASAVAITGGTIAGLGTPLAVSSGGSGAATLTGYVIGNGTSAMTASATIPNTDITGLGTMSVQSSDAVTITGGTANGLTIGASNPAAVTATTLRVNSTVSLAGDTGVAGQVLTSNGGSAPTWTSVAGVGTVTSVDGSGGTTGLSLSGGPITASGTLTLGGTLAVANGGTGSTTAPDALTALGAYPASNPDGFTNNTGTVTDVTGTAPIASSGGTTPDISISQATTSTDGYLSSTDWNTFNGKGTVTSVSGTGTVNGLSLSGTVTTSGDLTLGGTLSLVSPPPIGTTTPAEVKVTVGWAANTALTDAATVAWDTNNQVATFTFVSSNRTFGAPTNLKDGAFYALAVIQNAGSNTLTWDSVFKWAAGTAPTLSTAAGAKDYFTFRSDGTNLYQQGISQAVA